MCPPSSSCWGILLRHSRAPPRDLFVVHHDRLPDAARPPIVHQPDPPTVVSTPKEPHPSPATQKDKSTLPPATKAMLQLLGALLAKIVQSLPAAKREKIETVINEIVEGVVEPTKPDQRTESAERQTMMLRCAKCAPPMVGTHA